MKDYEKYRKLGHEIGTVVDDKNERYGDAFNKSGDILKILYPDGVKPHQYHEMLSIVRVIDKLFRVAYGNQGEENAWADITGYGLLGLGRGKRSDNNLVQPLKMPTYINTLEK